MRNWINIVEGIAPRSIKKLIEKHYKTFRLVNEHLPDRFDDVEHFVIAMSDADPNGKYTDWLCNTYINAPWKSDENEIIKNELILFDNRAGKLDTYDIYQYNSVDDLKAAYQHYNVYPKNSIALGNEISIKLLKSNEDWRGNIFVKGRTVGGFQINSKFKSRGVVTMHLSIIPQYQRAGCGTRVYDYIDKFFTNQNLKLMPNPMLSKYAFSFWKKRMPEFIETHYSTNDHGGATLDSLDSYSEVTGIATFV